MISIRLAALLFCGMALDGAVGAESVPDEAAPSPAKAEPPVATTAVRVDSGAIEITASGSKLPDLSWVPPEDGYDWVQLKSGEWLKGRIKALQDAELEFDSEELDNLTFDWKDVRQLRSARRLDVLLEEGKSYTGRVAITPDEVRVEAATPVIVEVTVPRSQLQSLTPGGSKEKDRWSGKASIGLTLRSGNVDQVEYNAQGRLERRTPGTRFSLDYLGYVSSIDDVESANNHRVNTAFDVWVSRQLYLILPYLEYYKDPFQNLDYRLTAGVGLGYDIIYRPNLEWSVSTGPAYQRAKFSSSQPGEPTESESGAVVLSTRYDWEINKRVDLLMEYRGQLTKEEVGETTHHFNSTLSVEVTKRIDLDISFIWDRVSSPKADEDGVVPEPDDYRVIFGFGMDF